MTLSGSIGFSNIRWVGIIQLGQIGVQLVAVVTLARLLAPADYGLMAMATSVTALAYLIRNMGTATALIQIKLLPPDLLNTMFCFNLVWGVILGIAVVLLSHAVALGFGQAGLEFVLMALAVVFPLDSLNVVPQALMERDSRFRDLARIEIFSSFVGFFAALLAAWNGFGVYSLVLQALAGEAVLTALVWHSSAWRPTITWNQAEFRKVWHFTVNITGYNIANYLHRNADNILIGRFFGATNLGWYNMAYSVMLFPLKNLTWLINRALLPVYARQDRAAIGESYIKVLSLLALVNAPLMCGLWAVRTPLVQVVLGEKWLPVSAVLTWLLPAGFLQCFTFTTVPLLTATGRTDVLRNLAVSLLPLWLIAFICGLRYGVIGVAAAYFFATLLALIPTYYFTLKEIHCGIGNVIASIWRPSVVGLVMVAVVTMVDMWVIPSRTEAWLRLAILVPVGAGFYLASICLVARGLLREFNALLWQRV